MISCAEIERNIEYVRVKITMLKDKYNELNTNYNKAEYPYKFSVDNILLELNDFDKTIDLLEKNNKRLTKEFLD